VRLLEEAFSECFSVRVEFILIAHEVPALLDSLVVLLELTLLLQLLLEVGAIGLQKVPHFGSELLDKVLLLQVSVEGVLMCFCLCHSAERGVGCLHLYLL
jgi:hypothetical protein